MKPLNKTSDLLVLDFINEKNPTAELELSKVSFDDPRAKTPEDATADGTNTDLTVKARKNSGYIGTQDVDYNRLDGVSLFRNVTAYLDVKLPKTTTDLLTQLNAQYGLKLTADDIVPADIPADTNPPVTDPDAPDPVPVDHTITFAETCLAYIGTIPVKIGPKPQVGERLSLVIPNTKLDGLVYPDGADAVKGQAYIYSYGIDATAVATFLKAQAEGVMSNDTAFAVEMNKIVPELWVGSEDAADYNLKGANVIYNGATIKQVDDGAGGTKDEPVEGANTEFNNVMLLELSDTLCSNFTGTMFLHYNA
ncbi:putative virion structural protein [Erwinia phage vB_EamM_Phobos]|uniref:virion structural protein n=1 Tax=Erwinia phage vB_EamM_Phobos TaxID=1883377 RepID=UPI00081CE91F|nr:virion structural protein [Erwinia phage vB_EamM_Phobos]ANZ50330.1 putative virion structural protein [Erwinia phage vB_EamM_Phobos]